MPTLITKIQRVSESQLRDALDTGWIIIIPGTAERVGLGGFSPPTFLAD